MSEAKKMASDDSPHRLKWRTHPDQYNDIWSDGDYRIHVVPTDAEKEKQRVERTATRSKTEKLFDDSLYSKIDIYSYGEYVTSVSARTLAEGLQKYVEESGQDPDDFDLTAKFH